MFFENLGDAGFSLRAYASERKKRLRMRLIKTSENTAEMATQRNRPTATGFLGRQCF